jgi:NADPH2:quinone reductase
MTLMNPSFPDSMCAVEISAPGGPDVLQSARRPIPRLSPGELLIEVHAAGINRPDVLQRQGVYAPPPDASDLPGLEVAGRVVSIAEGVTGWHVGDAVCALANGGGYAEYCAVPAGQCLPVPKGLDFVQAASLPETCFTVWTNVFDRGDLRPGETFLVQGGTSGIGVTAIQLVHAFGNRVFATAGSAEKCAACVELGAELAINYRTEDFVDAVKKATDGRGVDVILDMVGGEYVPRELKALANDGRLVLIAFLGGARATVNLADLMMRRLVLTGSTLRARTAAIKAEIARSLREKVWPLIEAGQIRPVIHAVLPLDRASEAHTLMESGTHIGKIVLAVR